jgi:hypothetical protein
MTYVGQSPSHRSTRVNGDGANAGKRPSIQALGFPKRESSADHHGTRHWKTEVVAPSVEMLSGRRKRDYEVEPLAVQATGEGVSDTLGKRTHSSTPAGPFRVACHGPLHRDPDALNARAGELVADLVEPAKSEALDKCGEGRQALDIAAGWVRTKLAPRPISTTEICAGHGQG